MTTSIFLILVFALATVSSLFTEAFKKVFNVTKPTVLVAILSAVIGWGGGAIAYILMGISFNLISCICLFLLAPTIWLCATLGYDKVMEAIEQILGSIKK